METGDPNNKQVKGMEKHNIQVVTQIFRTVDFHVKQTENYLLFILFPQNYFLSL